MASSSRPATALILASTMLLALLAAPALAQSLPPRAACGRPDPAADGCRPARDPCGDGPCPRCCAYLQYLYGEGSPLEGCHCYPDFLAQYYSVDNAFQACGIRFARGSGRSGCPAVMGGGGGLNFNLNLGRRLA